MVSLTTQLMIIMWKPMTLFLIFMTSSNARTYKNIAILKKYVHLHVLTCIALQSLLLQAVPKSDTNEEHLSTSATDNSSGIN